MAIIIPEEEKEQIKNLLKDIDNGLFIFLEKCMYNPEIFNLDDHTKNTKANDALKVLRELLFVK